MRAAIAALGGLLKPNWRVYNVTGCSRYALTCKRSAISWSVKSAATSCKTSFSVRSNRYVPGPARVGAIELPNNLSLLLDKLPRCVFWLLTLSDYVPSKPHSKCCLACYPDAHWDEGGLLTTHHTYIHFRYASKEWKAEANSNLRLPFFALSAGNRRPSKLPAVLISDKDE